MGDSCTLLLQRLCIVLYFTPLLLKLHFTMTDAVDVGNGTKLVLRLIHRDFIPSLLPADETVAPLIPHKSSSIFLVNFSIGEPPVPQLLAMDTGSSLIWTQCPLCTGCIPAPGPTYDPKTSSTYANIPCNTRHTCITFYGYSRCGQDLQCAYDIGYLDESHNTGTLALEKFTFLTSTGGIVEIPNLVFGCGLESLGLVRELSGILGLQSHNRYSLVSRVGNKFSYCIGNISDPTYMYNQLILGEGAVLEGYSTPLGIRNGHYMVNLLGISVGNKQLDINPLEFDFNVVIDSGSTLTFLQRSAFEQVKKEVMNLLDGVVEPAPVVNAGERSCYLGNLVRDLKWFPLVTLNLAEGAGIDLDVEAMFKRVSDDAFCMALDVAKDEENIIGVLAQQNYNIGFDLNAKKVSFQRIECELLED